MKQGGARFPRASARPRARALIAGAAALIVLRSGALQAAAPADDLEPGVQTSTAAAPVAAAGKPATGKVPSGKATAGVQAAATVGKAAGQAPGTRAGGAHDRVELDTTQITGNRELPNVMYVVPWKKPELGDFGGRPPKSLLDELLAPVDRDVFRRQNRYYSALKAGAGAGQGAATGTAPGSGPGGGPGNGPGNGNGEPAPRIAVDEK